MGLLTVGGKGISEVPEEEESVLIYRKNKRVKNMELSNSPEASDSEFTKEEAGSVSPDAPRRISTSDLPVESESISPSVSERTKEKGTVSGDGISMDVEENTLMDSVSREKVQIDLSNRNVGGNCGNMDMLTVTVNIENSIEVPRVVSVDPCSQVPQKDLDENQSAHVSNDTSATNEHFCDSHVLTDRPLEENCQEHDVESAKENIVKLPEVYSCDAFHLEQNKHSVASSIDPSVSQFDGIEGLSSEVVNKCVDVVVDKAFAGYNGKKLLVLDVNGLLVDISSYVPYDYDPDEIIFRKAVFKRPYCDDFLKFCFERFNVGVWTSKTKRNMEPILDFLLGNEKSKLLFCWDQSHCTYTGYYAVERRHKPLLLKKLKKLWDKVEPDLPWERGLFNEYNTLLLDDSPYKALCNPRYTAIFPYTYHFRDMQDNSLGPEGDLRAYLHALATAENVQEYVRQNPFGQRAITEKNLSWGYYLKVIEASSSPPHQAADASSSPLHQTADDALIQQEF
ncbi:uncharacterized protein LOC142529126 isoform X2 [Primulina tabacum]|uniref:uncharacterized protein LOC142529126 isoform X2 n=1 Tax=Primulina tabacum TaxID=48773 RepID=UPI003F596DD8